MYPSLSCLISMRPAKISYHHRHHDRNSLLNTGRTVVLVLFQFLWLMLFNSRQTERCLYPKCPLFSKWLVNALIFMYTTESTRLLHNFYMNLHFYSHYFWFYSENVSLCLVLAARGGQRSGCSWQGFSVLLKDTLADWVLASVGLEPSSTALQPQRWQLIGI